MSRTAVSRPESDLSTSRPARTDGLLTIAGAGIFAAAIIVLHAVEDEFQPCCRFVSEYVLGDWGWLMNIGFLAMGGAFVAVAHGLRSTLSPGRRVSSCVRLLYAVAVTTFVSGLFNSDSVADANTGRTTWHGAIHDLGGFSGILLAVTATFLLRGVFARDPQWRRFAPHALMFAILMVATFALVLFAPWESFGIAQRVFITIDVLWIGTLGCALLSAQPAASSRI